MTTAVIGAGIAGLVAAHELIKRGERPVIIEPNAPGGMICSEQRDGFTFECGPNVLVERPDMVQLLQEIGLASEVRYPVVPRYGQWIWCDGMPHKVPAGIGELLGSSLFPWSVKLSLPARFLRPNLLKPHAEDVSILEFFTPLIGSQVTRNLLDPVLKGIYGGDVARLSARSIFPGLWSAAARGLSLLGYMRQRAGGKKPAIFVVQGGIQRVVEALWSVVKERVQLVSARAEAITHDGQGGYIIRCSNSLEISAKKCVITTAGEALSSLTVGIDKELSERIQQQEYAGLSVVHIAVSRSEPLIKDAFGILFPGGMPENLLGVMFNSLIFPHVAPSDKHVLTVIVGGAQAGDSMPDEARLREQVPLLLRRYLGINSPEVRLITKWPKAIPQLLVGHHKLVASFDRSEGKNPGIVFVGVDRGGIGVSDRVRLARSGVERLGVVKRDG
jgi:oxygen-dependent protoporphyrinogen oxidase